MNPALSTELKSQQIGREKGQHVIIFHCQVEICIAVSCRFSLLLLSFLPPVRALCCAGACLTAASNELNELTSSQYALFHKKSPFLVFFGGNTKNREHSRERTWTTEAPSTNFAYFGVRDRAKIRLLIKYALFPEHAK